MPNSPEGYVPEEAHGMSKKDAELMKYRQKLQELTEAAKNAEGEDLEIIEENIELQKKLIAATETSEDREDRRKRTDSILVDIDMENPTMDAPKPISAEEQKKMKRTEEEEIQELLKGIREHGGAEPGAGENGDEKAA